MGKTRDESFRAPSPREITRLARGLRGRTLVTARLAARTGLKAVEKALRPGGSVEDIDADKAVEAARRLLAELDGMKGLVMKFGQMASYLEGSLPPAAQRVLTELQADSTPMTFEAVAEVIEAEFDQPVDALFDRFERRPFAAASIGQVHRAEFGGKPVAVKVQYPDIATLFHSDLRTIGTIAQAAMALSPVRMGELVDELRERVLEECDYLQEAAHQRLFRRLLQTVPRTAVPAVVDERSTRRVLCTEYVTAPSFYEFARDADQAAKDRAAATIFETCFSCIFCHCVFNADPHPGNYLFADDGRVFFLDFGCVKRFSLPFVERWKQLAWTVLNGDRQAFPDAYVAVGLAVPSRRFDWDYQWEMMRYLYEPVLSTEPFTFTHEYVRRSYDVLIWRNPNKYRVRVPRDWLFVNRLQWGLHSVLALLGATAPWPELWRRALSLPTTPAASPPARS